MPEPAGDHRWNLPLHSLPTPCNPGKVVNSCNTLCLALVKLAVTSSGVRGTVIFLGGNDAMARKGMLALVSLGAVALLLPGAPRLAAAQSPAARQWKAEAQNSGARGVHGAAARLAGMRREEARTSRFMPPKGVPAGRVIDRRQGEATDLTRATKARHLPAGAELWARGGAGRDGFGVFPRARLEPVAWRGGFAGYASSYGHGGPFFAGRHYGSRYHFGLSLGFPLVVYPRYTPWYSYYDPPYDPRPLWGHWELRARRVFVELPGPCYQSDQRVLYSDGTVTVFTNQQAPAPCGEWRIIEERVWVND